MTARGEQKLSLTRGQPYERTHGQINVRYGIRTKWRYHTHGRLLISANANGGPVVRSAAGGGEAYQHIRSGPTAARPLRRWHECRDPRPHGYRSTLAALLAALSRRTHADNTKNRGFPKDGVCRAGVRAVYAARLSYGICRWLVKEVRDTDHLFVHRVVVNIYANGNVRRIRRDRRKRCHYSSSHAHRPSSIGRVINGVIYRNMFVFSCLLPISYVNLTVNSSNTTFSFLRTLRTTLIYCFFEFVDLSRIISVHKIECPGKYIRQKTFRVLKFDYEVAFLYENHRFPERCSYLKFDSLNSRNIRIVRTICKYCQFRAVPNVSRATQFSVTTKSLNLDGIN